MEFSFQRNYATHINIPEAAITVQRGEIFKIFSNGKQIATLVDQGAEATGIFKGKRFTTNESMLLDSSLKFTMFDEADKVFAIASPANIFKWKKINIEFLQHNYTFNMRRISGTFIRVYHKGNIEFYSGKEIFCTVWPTGKIELKDQLPPEFIIPLLLMYRRFEAYKQSEDAQVG